MVHVPALVQIIHKRRTGNKPLPGQCWGVVYWAMKNRLMWTFNQNTHIFFQNEFQNAGGKCRQLYSGYVNITPSFAHNNCYEASYHDQCDAEESVSTACSVTLRDYLTSKTIKSPSPSMDYFLNWHNHTHVPMVGMFRWTQSTVILHIWNLLNKIADTLQKHLFNSIALNKPFGF